MLHNSKLNKNLNRNQALPMSFETGAVVNGRRREDTTDEHQYQAIEHAQTKLKLYKTIKNAKGEKQKEITKLALDLYKKMDFRKLYSVPIKKGNRYNIWPFKK